MDKLQQQKEHFDSIALKYREARSHPNHTLLKKLIWDYALKNKAGLRKPHLSVLEAMCGFADGYAILSEYCNSVEYQGFDYSSRVVEHMNNDSPHLHIWQEDISRFQSDTQYDVIILLGGLHHVPDIAAQAIQQLYTNLLPGGYFINLEPTHGNPVFSWARNMIYRRNKLFDEETEQAFAVQQLLDMFGACGFVAEDIIYPGLLSYVLYYNPDAFPWLNRGSQKAVSAIWACEKPFLRTRLARWFSFATLSIWKKPV